ncbi:MAG: hypothetical protein KDJ29_08130, partial [Hyphomicrobiales bacterium]|nr:hypothetical protein [Hyphomicrobiales bacterium]
MAEDSRAENSRAARSRPDNQDGIGALDPYVSVRAQLVARKWDKSSEPRNNWFLALAKAGLTGLLTGSSGAQYGRGLANMLAAAEIFGAFCVPLSYPAAAGAAATLAASGN